ncbi:aquaporin-like protein [Irpex rosettiformis]|uniref:Aquaporin-like protein n=1 Tax=Irpex rosettiformis TaxID=378272 RepID=A0ACB8TY92_9APHY|nr:aquaporin-like protein [Irpex rosettiformis]
MSSTRASESSHAEKPLRGEVAVITRGLSSTSIDASIEKAADIEQAFDSDATVSPRRSKLREFLCEPAAEFLGVLILVVFGSGVNCAVALSSNSGSVLGPPKGDWLSVSFGWAVGIGLGVWVSGSISGGHINPAVTLAMATLHDFPWRKVPLYILAQLLGGICGAGIVYGDYIHAIDAFEGGRHVRTLATAGFFGTFAADYLTNVSAFFEEFLGTAMLLLAICAATDKRKGPASPERVPIAVFMTMLGISVSIGAQTGFALNPARDLGPRILTAMVGYGRQVFDFRHQYWIWCGVMAPILGALVGVSLYDFLFYTGTDSIFNNE